MRSKTWAYDRWLTGIVGSHPTGAVDVSIVIVVCGQVEVSETG